MEAGATWTPPLASEGINRTIYFFEGDHIIISGKRVEPNHGIEVMAHKETVIVNGKSPARFLMLQGKPIKEPVVNYGPFVMNTREEINQALSDLHEYLQF